MAHSLRGVQKLKSVRSEDGQVDGCLQCSVVVDFGASTRLEFEDSLPGVPVSYVFNPLEGVFLADEVQRLMRIGIGSWLQIELRPERVFSCQRLAAGDVWDVIFRLPLPDGLDCDLQVAVDAAHTENGAISTALNVVAGWVADLDRRPLGEDLVDLMASLDLAHAPRLRCGLTLVEAERVGLATL